jgi:hypothetical protein
MTQSYNLSQLANNLNTAGQLDATDGLSGAVPPANGGTGLASYTVGDIIYASGTTALAKLADVATGNVLISGGVGVAPSYGKVGLTTHVSGTLPVANGGTGLTTLTANNVMLGNGTSSPLFVAPGTSGNILTSNGTTWSSAALSLGANSLGTNGYQRLAGGLIIQWGYSSTYAAVTFPLAFPSNCWSVNNTANGFNAELGLTSVTRFGFTPTTNGNTGAFYWMAFGN